MMASAGAQMLNAVVDIGGGEVPDGALFHLDFVNNYYWNGTNFVAANTVIDIPEQITANGLEIEDAEANLLGAFLTALIALDWTVVINYDHTFDTDTNLLVVSDDGVVQYIDIQRGTNVDGRRMYVMETGDSEYREAINTGPFNTGIHQVAVTRTSGKVVISTDGSAIASDTSAMDFTGASKAALGGYPGFGGLQWVTIKTVTLYPAQDDGDLPTLSTP